MGTFILFFYFAYMTYPTQRCSFGKNMEILVCIFFGYVGTLLRPSVVHLLGYVGTLNGTSLKVSYAPH